MNKKIKIAYFDLDGTIVTKNNQMSAKTLAALLYLKKKGVKVGIATGRSYFSSAYFISLFQPNIDLICSNGSWILDFNFPHKTLDFIFINKQIQNDLLVLLFRYKVAFSVYTLDGIYASSEHCYFFQKRIIPHFLKYPHKPNNCPVKVISDPVFYQTQNIVKILLVIPKTKTLPSEVNVFLSKIHHVIYNGNLANILDIFCKHADKKTAIKGVLNKYGYHSDEVVFFGDSENDILALDAFTYSVTLPNGTLEAKKVAKFITQFSCEQDGVADFILQNF